MFNYILRSHEWYVSVQSDLLINIRNFYSNLLELTSRLKKGETNPTWDMMSVFVIATNYNSVQFLKVAMIQNTSRHT